ncbi:MAG TPA: response regulator [Candidatus Baltobacteraceae bacterium]|nr:response regulator [Candidatus Baltobacteraceae bacterium]
MAYRILVADDEPYVVMAITSILVDLPAEVLEAADGDQVLSLAKTEHLDLILLDIKMPGLDGFQVATALKQDPATATIPIMFVSALGAPAEKARGLELGADDYIAKPIDGEELKARVRTILRRKRRPRAGVPTSGLLQTMKLPSLMHTLEAERRTTGLHLTRGDDRGDLWFVEGHIARAAQGSRRGEAAVYELLTWTEGAFQMVPVDPGQQVGGEVAATNRGLLIEGARRLAELPSLRAQVLECGGPLQVAPAVLDAIRLQGAPTTAAVLALLDGQHSLDQILAQSALDRWGTLRVILRARTLGVLESEAAGADRRSHLRVRINLPIEYQRLAAPQQATTYDLTSVGAFIRTETSLEKGAQVLLAIGLPGREHPLRAVGRVVWSNDDPDSGGGRGIGVHFQEANPAVAGEVETYLARAIAAQLDEERDAR